VRDEEGGMAERTSVYVYARDTVTQTGIMSALRGQPEVRVMPEGEVDAADVALVAVEEIDEEALRVIRALQRNGVPRVVLVVTKADEAGLLAAVEAGICGLVRRSEATTGSLLHAIRSAANGDGSLPPDLVGTLLGAMGRLQRNVLDPRGLTFTALTKREVEVLRLVADGMDTSEVARQLSYSERTIKNVIHDVMMRLNLRNRTHAVAYALRQGLI
jgi:DNA-binding NarL/FixJ family response regulator